MSLKDPLSLLRPEKVNRFDLPFQILFHLPRGYLRRVSPVCNLVQHRDCLSERLFKWTLAFLSGCSEQLETRLALRCGRKTRCASRLTPWGTERSEWSMDNCIRLCADHWYPVTGLQLVFSFIEPQPFHNRNHWNLVGIWICYLSRYPGICNTSNDMVKLPLASLELLAGVQKWRRSRILNQARWTASWRDCLKMCTTILMFKWKTPTPPTTPQTIYVQSDLLRWWFSLLCNINHPCAAVIIWTAGGKTVRQKYNFTSYSVLLFYHWSRTTVDNLSCTDAVKRRHFDCIKNI